MNTFGERLKLLRTERRISLEKLSQKLCTTKATLSRYENNKREPKINMAEDIANFFDVSLDFLLGKTDVKKPEDRINFYTETGKETMLLFEKTLRLGDNMSISEQNTRITIVISKSLKDELKYWADYEGRSISDYTSRILERYIDAKNKKHYPQKT